MKTIPLTQNKFALVDDADFVELSKHKWHAHKNQSVFYAASSSPNKRHGNKIVKMHRHILGLKYGDGVQIDHRDGNGLNNQKSNLRICTYKENQMNRRKARGSSRYKGVYWCDRDKRWMAKIFYKKAIYIGSFKSETEAAKAYNQAALKHFGEFANINKGVENGN